MNLIALAEKGLLPDAVIRWGIRRLDQKRLQDNWMVSHYRLRKRNC